MPLGTAINDIVLQAANAGDTNFLNQLASSGTAFQPFAQQQLASYPTTATGDTTFQNLPVDATVVPGYSPSTSNIVSNLPTLRGASSGDSKIDPALTPYLQMGLQRAEQLFFGDVQPSMYPGQMYVSPSQQTLDALAAQEAVARSGVAPLLAGQQAYASSLGQLGQTAAGNFLTGSPYQQAAIQSATRPLVQQFEQTTLPSIASLYSKAGRYGSGAMERALGTATEATGRAIGDVASQMANQQYLAERQLQQQAQGQQAQLGAMAPQFYAAQYLPAQQLAQVGQAQEQIAAQPLQEAIQRYQFQQQLPYSQLQSYLSSVYGTPLASSVYPTQPQAQTNYLAQGLGGALLGSQVGSLFGGFGGLSGSQAGSILGGLGGLLL